MITVKAINRQLRKWIFWIFVLFFFILAPLLVFYTAGYRYNINSRQIVRTGVLSISSIPRNISVYLNDELQKEKTPIIIKRLMPNEYNIRLEKEGYHSWFGQFEVYSGATTIINQIILFLDSEPKLLFHKNIEKLTENSNKNLIAYTVREGGWEEIWLYDINNDKHQIINQTISPNKPTELSWSKNGEYLLTFNPDSKIQVFNNNGNIIQIHYITSNKISSAYWHVNNDDILYLASDEGLEEVNLNSKTSRMINNTNKNSISLDSSMLNFVNDGTYTELIQSTNNQQKILALLPKSDYTVVIQDSSYIMLISDNILMLLDLDSSTPILLKTEATIFDWSYDKNLLVYSDGYEVNVYNPEDHISELITRQSEKIKSITWSPSTKNILLQHGDSAIAYEYEKTGDCRKTVTLINDIQNIKYAWISNDGQTLFYYANQFGIYGMYRLELTKPFISL